MRISELIDELERIRVEQGDLVVTHYSFEKHWEPIGALSVLPAGASHGRRRNTHEEPVVEIGDGE